MPRWHIARDRQDDSGFPQMLGSSRCKEQGACRVGRKLQRARGQRVCCRQEKILKDTGSCLSCGDVTDLSLTRRRGCGQQSLLAVAAGVRVTQKEQTPRAGREAARHGG